MRALPFFLKLAGSFCTSSLLNSPAPKAPSRRPCLAPSHTAATVAVLPAPTSLLAGCRREWRSPPPAPLTSFSATPESAASVRQRSMTGMDDLADFEFFQIILEAGSRKLRLPNKFTELLDGREPREVKLREDGGGSRLWDVEVVFPGDGHMYLGRGWEQFAREYDVQLGHFLVFSYDGDTVLTVKVFDGTMCRRHYKHDDDNASTASVPLSSQSVTIKDEDFSISPGSESSSDSGSKNSSIGSGSNGSSSKAEMEMEMDIDDGPTSQFTVMLRECHLGKKQKQYLNVPIEFQAAHGYAERSKVVLRMRGKSWSVNLKHNIRTVGKPRTSLRYGWNQFCVDNRLAVGDTCFFRALRGGDTGRGEDHVLKVEVRKRDGTFAH